MAKINLVKQLEAYAQGKYLDSSGAESWCFNFYDWFCKESTLKKKSDTLYKLVKKIVPLLPVDQTKVYVFFKNNCPCFGKLYDDFRVCDVETGDVIFNFVPKSGHNINADAPTELWSKLNGFQEPLLKAKNPTELIKMLIAKPIKME